MQEIVAARKVAAAIVAEGIVAEGIVAEGIVAEGRKPSGSSFLQAHRATESYLKAQGDSSEDKCLVIPAMARTQIELL